MRRLARNSRLPGPAPQCPGRVRRRLLAAGVKLVPCLALAQITGCTLYDPDLLSYQALDLLRSLLVQAVGLAFTSLA